MLRNYLIIASVSYLIGSIPFGYILVRIFKGQDIRTTGSGNIGATNVARSGAMGLAALTLILDGAKGYVAMYVAGLIWSPSAEILEQLAEANQRPDAHIFLPFAMAALSAVVGHMFPVWLGFKGGKGVATAVGAFLWLSPAAIGITFIVFVIVVAVTRYVSLGSLIGAAVLPFVLYLVKPEIRNPAVMAALAGISLLIIAKHHENIRRLLSGTENRFVLKRKAAAVQLANED